MSEADDLDKLFEQIADGGSVDWDALERAAPSDETRQRLRQLRLIAEVAEAHRSNIDDVTLAEDDIVTVPATTTVDVWPAPGGPGGEPPGWGEAPAPLPVDGTRWGHLLLVRKIGEGAFGEVFHAHDTWLDHPVALKLLKRDAESRVSPSLILHEARKLARVRHSNVVTVHGADRHDGRVGFWMDFVDGETLAARVAKGRLSAGEATYVGQEVCKALAAVHQAKLIHRDVKAHNVMRASDGGRIILMDFGAGELVNDPSLGGRQHGTPLYLAPELLSSGDASVQSDIYAVGVLLYHLVSGRYPVEAASPSDLLEAHNQGMRRRLRDERSDLPRSFIEIVEQAVHPDPARRFISAGAMEDKLAGEPTAQLPQMVRTTKSERLTALQYIQRAAAFVAGMVLFTFILGFIVARAFDVIIGVPPNFSLGPLDTLLAGGRALIPLVFYSLVGAAIIGALSALRLLPAKVLAPVKWVVAKVDSWDPMTTAVSIIVVGAASWAIVNFVVFGALIDALYELQLNPATSRDLSILGPAHRDLQLNHYYVSTAFFMLLTLAAWRWFPRLEQRATQPSSIWIWKWGAVILAFAFVIWASLPRRVIWERFPVVTFDHRIGLVIGDAGPERLIYTPDEPGRSRTRTRIDSPDWKDSGETRFLFDRR